MPEAELLFARNVESRLGRIDQAYVERISTVSYGTRTWPLFCVRPPDLDPRRPVVLISGGVHGDEPAGVYAALELLNAQHRADPRVQFVVFPCVNPSGFDANTLATASGANLNRLFGLRSTQREVLAIETWLSQHALRFLATFDLHEVRPDYVGEGYTEADNPQSAYLYETVCDQSPRVGRAMIEALPPGRAVCEWPTIYDDINDRGLVSYPQARRNQIYAQETSFDSFLISRYTAHSFTLETPTGWPLADRVATHLTFVNTALNLLS
jgi:hypothetical protein